jgi:hypothetical protein
MSPMKTLAFRVLSGITAAVTLIALPAAATAGPPDPDPTVPGPATRFAAPTPAAPRPATNLPFRLTVTGATAHGSYQVPKTPGLQGRPASVKPGAAGIGQPAQAGVGPVREKRTARGRVAGPAAQLVVNLKVSDRTRCGVLQLTTNGPADGIEWYTIAALCKSGTATVRVEAPRLPWSGGTLPSLRLCNGERPALAEGDDCDTYRPPLKS